MTQVSLTACALGFNPMHAIGEVIDKQHGFVVFDVPKTRPAGATIKLRLRIKELLTAGDAEILAFLVVFIKFPTKRGFGSTEATNSQLFWCEFLFEFIFHPAILPLISWSFKVSSSTVYLLALGANFFFSTASLIFSLYSKKFSPWWVNQLKVSIAITLFGIACLLTPTVAVSYKAIGFLMFSGFIGLCIGDLFLFKAYTTLGAGRSLVLFSFQPILLGLYGWIFLSQVLSLNQVVAVTCMIACLFVFLLERNKLTGSWDLKSFLWAFAGIFLDASGVMLTREAYEMTEGLDSMQVNFIRCTGALLGFVLIKPKMFVSMFGDFMQMKKRESALIIIACICGTFVSLSLYLAALKHAHMASLTAVAITGPVWVSILECFWERKLPNRYLSAAFALFVLGFYFMAK